MNKHIPCAIKGYTSLYQVAGTWDGINWYIYIYTPWNVLYICTTYNIFINSCELRKEDEASLSSNLSSSHPPAHGCHLTGHRRGHAGPRRNPPGRRRSARAVEGRGLGGRGQVLPVANRRKWAVKEGLNH